MIVHLLHLKTEGIWQIKFRPQRLLKLYYLTGTFTMAETAKYMAGRESNKTIVLTVSFILGSSGNTNAPIKFCNVFIWATSAVQL